MQRHTPLGYQIQNGKAEIEPETAELVKEVFNTYLAGTSTYRIAKDFTQRGILNASHKPSWNHGSIGKILENQKYLGDEFYPPLIERSIFEQVQSKQFCESKRLEQPAGLWRMRTALSQIHRKRTTPEVEVQILHLS